MNQSTVSALCFMLSKTPNDLLQDVCFRKMIFYDPSPLLVYSGLGLGQHYVNSYLESHGQYFANCVQQKRDFNELCYNISVCNLHEAKIAINLFSDNPLIIESVSPSQFRVLWAKNQSGVQINLQNYQSILPRSFDAFTIKGQRASTQSALSDTVVSIQFKKEYLSHLPILNIVSGNEKAAVLANLNCFVNDAINIGRANKDSGLIQSANTVGAALQNGIPTTLPNSLFYNKIKTLLDAIV
jgi:hypothetical protein